MNETMPKAALQAAREQVGHAIDLLDGVRADLEATVAALRLPDDEEEIEMPLAGEGELAAVIRCGLLDHLKPLIASLRSLVRCEPGREP